MDGHRTGLDHPVSDRRHPVEEHLAVQRAVDHHILEGDTAEGVVDCVIHRHGGETGGKGFRAVGDGHRSFDISEKAAVAYGNLVRPLDRHRNRRRRALDPHRTARVPVDHQPFGFLVILVFDGGIANGNAPVGYYGAPGQVGDDHQVHVRVTWLVAAVDVDGRPHRAADDDPVVAEPGLDG